MILGPDRSRLSKRHGATSVLAFRDSGILPEAMVNYLARLGWSHGDQEIFTKEEMIRHFDLRHVGSAGAIFDQAKLEWLNAHWLRQLSRDELAQAVVPFVEITPAAGRLGLSGQMAELFTERAKTLKEIVERGRFFFEAPTGYDPQAVQKVFTPDALPRLRLLTKRLESLSPFDAPTIETFFRGLAAELGLKLVDLAQLARVALTGSTASPPLFQVVALLGRDETLQRLRTAEAFLESREK
jgi:glutamyl-tRNA synthetase